MKKNFLLPAILLLAFADAAKAQLPSTTLRTIDGRAIRTDTLRNFGKPFIIDFWATWCKPCNRELTAISEVYDEWVEETGLKLFAVSVDQAQNIHKVKPMVDQNEWPYDILLDTNSAFFKALGGVVYPYTLICDGEGKIVYKHSGYTEGAEIELIEKLRELVRK